MTRSFRLRSQAVLVTLLGSFGLLTTPPAGDASVTACYPTCIDAVWNMVCPPGYYVACNYQVCDPWVEGYCKFDE